jgi:uncharacterized protein (UPF0276 family)
VAGIGLRAPHYAQVLRRRPALEFLEVHSENFFAAGGPALAWLERFRAAYPLSFHGVGLSLGSADPLDPAHLARLAALVRRFDPVLVSEHLSWSSSGGRHANDLLPLPFTREALDRVVANIGAAQEALGREILVENVSSYLAFPGAQMPEWEFVAEAARRSGCRLLLDVNNIHVNAANHGFDARGYLDSIPRSAVGEIHVAGHEARDGLLVDTHGARVCDDVWALYARAVERFGARPTLVEWDTDIPALDVLLDEAAIAAAIASGTRTEQAA